MARKHIPVEDRAAIIWERLRHRISPEAAAKKVGKAKRTGQRYPDAATLEALDYLIANGKLQFCDGISSRPENFVAN